jgi:hypothetical protein
MLIFICEEEGNELVVPREFWYPGSRTFVCGVGRVCFGFSQKGELRVNSAVFELFALKSQTLVFVKTKTPLVWGWDVRCCLFGHKPLVFWDGCLSEKSSLPCGR